jgi:hypothetical protein
MYPEEKREAPSILAQHIESFGDFAKAEWLAEFPANSLRSIVNAMDSSLDESIKLDRASLVRIAA